MFIASEMKTHMQRTLTAKQYKHIPYLVLPLQFEYFSPAVSVCVYGRDLKPVPGPDGSQPGDQIKQIRVQLAALQSSRLGGRIGRRNLSLFRSI